MSISSVLESIASRILGGSTVRNVFGDPIALDDKTIVPVARIGFGFGAGSDQRAADGGQPTGEGIGGGGGAGAAPLGVFEVTPDHTRFVPVRRSRTILAALVVGFLVGRRLGGR